MTGIRIWLHLVGLAMLLVVGRSSVAMAQTEEGPVLGLMLSAGGRYDNVRMCVATPPDVPGGPAMDISFFAQVDVGDEAYMVFNVPVVRPLLFWLGFDMLQFEPTVRLTFDASLGEDTDLILGPVLGLSMHYGPDYHSDSEGETRGPSFWALGPTVGGYFGVDFAQPGELFNFQLGITPYLSPLFSVNDDENHQAIVVGGMLEGHFRLHPSN